MRKQWTIKKCVKCGEAIWWDEPKLKPRCLPNCKNAIGGIIKKRKKAGRK